MRNGAAGTFVLSLFLGAGAGAGAAGCALVLGFEETTLRSDLQDGAAAPIDDGGDGASADPDAAGDGRISAVPSSIVVRRGATADVTVTVARGPDLLGPLPLSVADLPAGVTVAPATIADAATSGVLTFTAAADAPFGSKTVELSIAGAAIAPLPLTLLVAGATGAPDPTFDGDGVAADNSKGGNATFYALAVQPDGKIVAAGAGAAGNPGWFVRRFDDSGAPDTAFTAALGALPADGEARAVAVDPAIRKIVLAGMSSPTLGAPQLTVMRREPSGAPDMSFAGGMFRFVVGDAPLGSTALAVAVQADGSVMVAGARREVGNGETGIALRLTPDGTRDVAFNGGKVLAIGNNRFVGVTVDPSGAVVIGGTDVTAPPGAYWLSRRLPAGTADPTFGDAGVVRFGTGFRAHAFARLADGSPILAGENAQTNNAYTMGVARSDGTPVFARAVTPGTAGAFRGVAVDPEQRIVAAGQTTGIGAEARVQRVLSDGGIDGTFGIAGASLLSATNLHAVAVQPDGRIVVAGGRAQAGGIVYRLWP